LEDAQGDAHRGLAGWTVERADTTHPTGCSMPARHRASAITISIRQRARGAAQRSAAAHRQRRSRERHRRRPADGSRQDARLLGTRRRTKRAGLLEGYGPIDRPNWQATLRLYQFYGAIELWTWWTRIGDAARAEHIVADLERYA